MNLLNNLTNAELIEIINLERQAKKAKIKKVSSINLFKEIKNDMNKEYKRLDKLIKAYFKLDLHTKLSNELLDKRDYNENIGNMFFSFNSDDIGKLTSMLRQIFSLYYFKGQPTTPTQFVNELKALLTSKNGKKRTHTLVCNRIEVSNDDDININSIGNVRPDTYKAKGQFAFNEKLVSQIIEAYM